VILDQTTIPTDTTTVSDTSIPLFTGTQGGTKPTLLNKESCQNSVYYFKTSPSNCICILKSGTIDDNSNSYEGSTSTDCANGEVTTVYSLQIPPTITSVNVARNSVYSSLVYPSGVHFTSTSSVSLKFDTLVVDSPIYFGTQIALNVTSISFSANKLGFLKADGSSITLPTTIALGIFILPTSVANPPGAYNCPLTNNFKRRIYGYQITEGCQCLDQLADCGISEFSEYYNLVVSSNTEINSNFNSIVIPTTATQNTIEISHVGSAVTVGTLDVSTLTTLNQLTIKSNVQITNFKNKQTYTIFENLLPTQSTSTVTTGNVYYYNSITNAPTETGISQVDCGSSSNKFIRVFKTMSNLNCDCLYNTPDVDCKKKPEVFHLKLDTSITPYKFTLTLLWLDVELTSTSINPMNEIVVLKENNKIIVGNTDFKLSSTAQTTINAQFKDTNTAYIYSTNVQVVPTTTTKYAYPLFVSTSSFNGLNSIQCNNIYRYFVTGTTANCDCKILDTDGATDYKDCHYQSVNYNANTGSANIKLVDNWNSLTSTADYPQTTIDMGNKSATSLIIKTNTNINGQVGGTTKLVTDGTKYVLIDTSGKLITIDVNQCGRYCASYKRGVIDTSHSADCLTNNKRISNGNLCYCTLNGDGSTYLETDCNHDTTKDGFDLYLTTATQPITSTNKYNSLVIKSDVGAVELTTTNNQIQFTKVDVSKNIVFSIPVTSIGTLTQTSTSAYVTFNKATTITTVVPKANGFILYKAASNEQLTITSITEPTGCVDVVYSPHANVNNVATQKLVVLNGKSTLKTSQCENTVECKFVKEQTTTYDDQFSTINCPCDNSVSGDTTGAKCKVMVESATAASIFTLAHNVKADVIVQKDIQFKTTTPYTIDNMTFSGSTLTATQGSEITLTSLTTTALTITGNVNINAQIGAVKATLTGNTKAININAFAFNEIVSASTNVYNLNGGASFVLECKKCTLSGTETITTLKMGNANEYTFNPDSQTTIQKLLVNLNGNLTPLNILGNVVFANVLKTDYTFSYPLVIAQLTNTSLFKSNADLTTTGIQVLCKNLVVLGTVSPSTQICAANNYEEVNEVDLPTNCGSSTTICKLTLKNSTTMKITKNYDSIICESTDSCSIGTIDATVTKLNLIGLTKIFTITSPPTFPIRATNCVLKITGSATLSAQSGVSIESSTGTLTLLTSNIDSITTSFDVVVKGDVVIGTNMVTTGMLTLTSGSLYVKKNLTFKSLTVASEFKLLTVLNTMTMSDSTGTITAANYYSHYAMKYVKCGPVDSILTANKDYTADGIKCITQTSAQIDLNTNEAYVNHYKFNCKDLTRTTIIKSPKVSCAQSVTTNSEVIVNVATTLGGSFTLSKLTAKADVTFLNDAHLTCSTTQNATGKVILSGTGEVTNCANVIHNSQETISITNVPSIELMNTGIFDLKSTMSDLKITITKSGFDKTIPITVDIDSISIIDSSTKIKNYVLIEMTNPIKSGNLGSYTFKCNNKKIVHGDSPMFSCEDFPYDVTYTTADPSKNPAQGCIDDTGINCIATVTVDAAYTLNTLNLNVLKSKYIKLQLNVKKILIVTMEKTVEQFELTGAQKSNEEMSYGAILSDILPKYTTVTDAILKVGSATTGRFKVDHIVYLNSVGTSEIDLTNVEANFWDFNCSTLKLTNVIGNISSPINIDDLTVSGTQLNISRSVNISKITILDTSNDVALFTVMQNIESITIGSGIDLESTECQYIFNYLGVSVKPTLSQNLDEIKDKNRIYVGACTFKLTKCALVSTSDCSIDIHENGNYQYTSLCPDNTVEIDLTQAKCGSVTFDGLSENEYSQITLPTNTTLQSSTTSPIIINTLVIKEKLILTSPYIITNLVDAVETPQPALDITLGANTQIVSYALQGETTMTIQQGATLNFMNTVQKAYTIKQMTIEGSELNVYGPNVELSIESLIFATVASTSSIINVKQFNMNAAKVSLTTAKRTTHIPLINTMVSMEDPTTPLTDMSLVCNKKTLIYKQTDSDVKFQCPDDVLCTYGSSECDRPSTGTTDYEQRYIIEVPSTHSGAVTLTDNSKLTKGYDVVNVKQSGAVITVANGGIYVFNISVAKVSISCADDTSDVSCSVIINNMNEDSYGVMLTGKNMILKEDTTIENLVANVNIMGDITLSSFEVTSLIVNVKKGGIMRVTQYASMKELHMEDGALVYSSDSFDAGNLYYEGGQIIFDSTNTEAVLNVNFFNVNNEVLTLGKKECIHPIIRQSFTNPEEVIDRPELVWKGKVIYQKTSTMVDHNCGYSKLDLCGSEGAEHNCENIECDTTDGDKRAICYCTYDPAIVQDCVLKCPDTAGTDCVFDPSQSSNSLFNKISIPKENTLNVSKLFKLFILPMSQNIIISATKSLNIFQITDVNGTGEITIDAADVSIDSIRLTNPESVLTINAKSMFAKEIYVTDGATLNINVPITLQTAQGIFDFTPGGVVPNVTRQIYFGKDAKINLKENANFVIQGPTEKDTVTNKYDAEYNKLTLEECVMTVDANFKGIKSNKYPNIVFNFDVIGEVVINKATLTYMDGTTTDKNITLILNNEVSHIAANLTSRHAIDDQNYALVIGQSAAILDKAAIPELSCDLTASFSGKVTEDTKWVRSQCPCNGETCIVNTELTTSSVNYDISGITFAKYYTTTGLLEGSKTNISELISYGGNTEVKITESTIGAVLMEKKGVISFTKPLMIPTISGVGESGTIEVKTHSLTTKSMTNVDMSISTGSMLFEKETKGDFKGRKITVAANGRLDIYTSSVLFDESTEFEVTVEAGQPALISVDDDALGDAYTIVNAKYTVTIPADAAGKVFAILRVLTPINVANFKIKDGSETPSAKLGVKGAGFVFKEACNGVILTDLPDAQITCPEDRMARVVEKFEFPMYMIAVIVVFVLVLAVIVVLLIVYMVHVYIVRRKNMKVFEDGEELDVDNQKQDEEIKNEGNKTGDNKANEEKHNAIEAPVPSEIPLANDQKTTSVLEKTSESGSESGSGSKKD
ncbi:hypothetical protein EIN_400750, partial [Entamoeba invadens IP1]